ncbi:MAG: IMP dehydrogenase [Lentisphaeria bacterium]|nr:IMP dehydrogenase [Candidatus Neomarinimicrobiota bacterium]MCF7841655.1 IMP dehydrogenase [Lentisphaeria bacterium]
MAHLSDLRGLTFDDVLLVPNYSDVLPREVNVHSRFTRGIELAIPLVSAAMDTVTEYSMATTIAALGGIGVIHKNMTIDEQVSQVQRVKMSPVPRLAPVIISGAKTTVGKISQDYHYERIAGVILKTDGALHFFPKSQIDGVENKSTKLDSLQNGWPVMVMGEYESLEAVEKQVAANQKLCIAFQDAGGSISGVYLPNHPHGAYHRATLNPSGQLRVAAGIGVTKDSLERGDALVSAGVDALVVDTAHGHSAGVIQTVQAMRKRYGDVQMIAGNIATTGAAEALSKTGVDGIKVGIGPGSICTTRIVAGVGVPQLTAIMEVAKAAGSMDMPVIADGGVRRSGDLAKALAAGSDAVMMGGVFAGTLESPGEVFEKGGKKYKSYRGMGSIGAMMKGSKDRYFQETQSESKKLVAEGVEGFVPLQGSVKDIVFQLIGGLKSSMGYCGARDLKNFREQAEFIRVTPASIQESHPHDLHFIKDAPNYKK